MILCHAVLTPEPWTQGTRHRRDGPTRGLHIRDKKPHQQRPCAADTTQHWRRTPHCHHSRYADAARDQGSTGLHWQSRVDSRHLWPSMDTRLRTPHVVSDSETVSLAATIAGTFIILWMYSGTMVLSWEQQYMSLKTSLLVTPRLDTL